MTSSFSALRHPIKGLLRSPGFTLVALASLALGIGTATGIFALVNGILLRSLPVPRPSELRLVTWTGSRGNFHSYMGSLVGQDGNSVGNAFSHELCRGMREDCADSAEVFAYVPVSGITVKTGAEALVADGMMVSGGFFPGLEVKALAGRVFGPQEAAAGEAATVVLSQSFWQRQYGGEPSAVGRTLYLNGHAHTIVGVLPAAFRGITPGAPPAFYTPISPTQNLMAGFEVDSADQWWFQVMARVRPGREASFRAALDFAAARRLSSPAGPVRMVLQDGSQGPEGDRRKHRETLLVMLGGAGILLLAACANLAGLALTRGRTRLHGDSIRAALGASRWHLMRPVLLEFLVLASVGALAGGLLAVAIRNGLSRLLGLAPDGLAYDLSISPGVLGFAVAASVAAALLSGLLPALKASRTDPRQGLIEHPSHGARRHVLGKVLIVAQFTFSLTLLSGAGLLFRSMHGLLAIDPGFDTRNLLLVTVDPTDAGHAGEPAAYHGEVLERLAALPGVEGAALIHSPLLGGSIWASSFTLPGEAEEQGREGGTEMMQVNETFFRTLGIPIVAGRDFRAGDTLEATKVAVVNEAFVRANLRGREPLNQLVRLGKKVDWQIVGVCRDVHQTDIRQPAKPAMFFSYRQRSMDSATYLLRSRVSTDLLVPLVRKAVAAVDPGVPISRIITQEGLRDRQIRQERLLATLAGCMAAFSLLLACIGLYGLIAFDVNRRMAEFGIRMALGAKPRDLFWLVLREALLLASAGAVLGLGCALAATRILKTFLYGVEPADPLTMAAVAFVLVLVAVLSSLHPIWRATRTDPAKTLRAT